MESRKMTNGIPYILNGEFFEILSQAGNNVTVRCCYCIGRNVYRGSVKSTGNFHMHIKRKHPGLIHKVQELKMNSFFKRRGLKMKIKKEVLKKVDFKQNVNPINLIINYDTINSNNNKDNNDKEKQDNEIGNSSSNDNTNNVTSTTSLTAINTDYMKENLNSIRKNTCSILQPLIRFQQVSLPSPPQSPASLSLASTPVEEATCATRNSLNVKEETAAPSEVVHQGTKLDIRDSAGTSVSTVNYEHSKAHEQGSQIMENMRSFMEEFIARIENSLKGVEQELRIRNQIEYNRLLLKMTKY